MAKHLKTSVSSCFQKVFFFFFRKHGALSRGMFASATTLKVKCCSVHSRPASGAVWRINTAKKKAYERGKNENKEGEEHKKKKKKMVASKCEFGKKSHKAELWTNATQQSAIVVHCRC